MSIQVNDILDFLVAKSLAPSTMGAQLDRLRFGIQTAPDPFRARDEVETHLMQQAGLIRCVDDFTSRQEFFVPARGRAATSGGYKALEKIQKHSGRPQGHIAIGILRAYHERCTSVGSSQERGLVEVYRFVSNIAPEAVPRPPKGESDLLQAFRTNAAKRARHVACEAYADALLALQQHVRIWNRKH